MVKRCMNDYFPMPASSLLASSCPINYIIPCGAPFWTPHADAC